MSAKAKRLKPLAIAPKLAPTPTGKPAYSVTVKNAAGDPVECADPNVIRALVALMDMHSVIGGAASHWGGPSAFAELSAAAHAIMFSVKDTPWHDAYHFVNDAGHCENGIYAVRTMYGYDQMTFDTLKGFRSLDSKLTGHGESHLNPEGVLLSNGPLGSALPQAQGLAMADKMTKKKRATICFISDGASMEGEAKESFAAIPGLAKKGLLAPFVMVVSDNDTKLSGRISKDSFDMTPTFKSLKTLGWNVIKVEDGHDLQAVYLALEDAIGKAVKRPRKPVAVWAKTIKGKGVKATEESESGGHGYPLKTPEKIVDFVSEIFAGNPPDEFRNWAQSLYDDWKAKTAAAPAPAVPKLKAQDGLAKGAIRAVMEGYPVISVSADLAGSTRMNLFRNEFPKRAYDMGVAESNMVSVAAGLAKGNLIPIVDTFTRFGVTKGNLPLTMASLSQAPVIAVFSHAGFQDAADGASHQATNYIALTAAIPHVNVVVISCAAQGEAYMYQTIKRFKSDREAGKDGESTVFFVGRENFPDAFREDIHYELGKAIVYERGTDVAIVAAGPMVPKAMAAVETLKQSGVSAALIENPFVNRLDMDTIAPVIEQAGGNVLTIEDHQFLGGMGSLLAHGLATSGIRIKMDTLAIMGEFGRSAYKADQLYDHYGLSLSRIVSQAKVLAGKA